MSVCSISNVIDVLEDVQANTWERGSRTYKKCSTEEHDIRGIKCNSFGNDQLVIGGYSSLMYSNGPGDAFQYHDDIMLVFTELPSRKHIQIYSNILNKNSGVSIEI